MFIIFYCYIKISVDDCGEEMKKANEVVWEGETEAGGATLDQPLNIMFYLNWVFGFRVSILDTMCYN